MEKYDHYSLASRHTFGVEAYADYWIDYDSPEDLAALIPILPTGMPVFHMGGGSNLLFMGDYKGVLLHSRIKTLEVVSHDEDVMFLRVGAGWNWDEFVDYCVTHHLYGLENLSLIPGEVGAAAVQNIGAYGEEVGRHIVEVEVMELKTGQRKTISQKDCDYSYRSSRFKTDWKGMYAVLYVTFQLHKHFVPNLTYAPIREFAETVDDRELDAALIREKIIQIRQEKLPDPRLLGNAGSFFKNPVISAKEYQDLQARYAHQQIPAYRTDNGVKIPAAWLIEKCGWKGRKLGRAGVYRKQALVLVNLGGATADEIVALSDRICQDVKSRFGIIIQPEVIFV